MTSSVTAIADLIASVEKIDTVLPIIERWGIKILDRQNVNLGFDRRPYVHIEAELPCDWKVVGLGQYFADIVDNKGARRLNLHHDPGEAHRSERSHYNILLGQRFALAADPLNHETVLLKDHKANQEVLLSNNGEFEYPFDDGYLERAVAEKYSLDLSNPAIHPGIALAPLWDRDISWQPYDIYDIYERMRRLKASSACKL